MKDWSHTWKKRQQKRKSLNHRFGNFRHFDKIDFFKWFALGSLIVSLIGIFSLILAFAWFSKDLPNPNKIVRHSGFSTKILDRQGELLYDMYDKVNRVPVTLDQVPIYLREATIAVEDKDFYKHGGFDPKGILRATFNTLIRGKLQGGSTLTQQLVKNVLLNSERTLSRKFKELVLAIQIERKFNKDEILQMYLNEAPYGGTAWGVAAGAEKYFGKKVSDLDLAESAMLAGLPQAPSIYSPFGNHPKAYLRRAKTVLRRMREDGYIDKQQEKNAINELETMKFKAKLDQIKAPHFVFYVKNQLAKILGDRVVNQGGLTVTTTLDYDLQKYAQAAVTQEIKKIEKLHITNGAAMVIDAQTGEILAMVGSKDFFAKDYDGQYNAALALRQPGSSIKPVTYALAFKRGYTPATMLMDVPTKFGTGTQGKYYQPKNYDGKFRGPVQLRFALGSSLNIPAVKLLALVGVKDMLSLAYDMGFETLKPTPENLKRFGLSVTLGAGEVRLLDLVRSYAVFANGGERIQPISILKVEKNGKTIYQAPKPKKKRVLSPEVTFLINHVLYDNNARLLTFGANSYLNMNGRPIAVKTGTTNDMKDNWTVGWSTKVVVGTWVGNNDDSPMKRVASGVTGASPIWRKIMLKAYEKYGGDNFTPPKDIVAKRVDVITGYAEHDNFPARSEYFIKGTEPTTKDPIHKFIKLCRGQNKLATAVDIARNNYEEKEFFDFNGYQSPSSVWQSDIQAWLNTVENPKYHPPTEYCDSKDDLIVLFEEPHDHDRLDNNQVKVKIKVIGNDDLEFLKLQVDNQTVEEFKDKEIETTINLNQGSYQLKAWAKNKAGKEATSLIQIGVKQDWDYQPPTPTPSPSPSPEASGSGT